MGVAYPRFSATAMDDLPSERVLPVATALAFAETSATAIAGFVGGGTYSLARSVELSPTSALGWAFALLATFGVASIALHDRSDAGGPAEAPPRRRRGKGALPASVSEDPASPAASRRR
jgi:hypothetical protein